MINEKLFETEDYLLTEIDFEKDPEVDARYTLDLRYAKYWCDGFTRPLSKNEMKKRYEKIEKKVDESGSVMHFAIRQKQDEKLIGYLRFEWVLWTNGVGWLKIAIADEEQTEKVLEQLVPLALNYSFLELNLFRVEMDVPAYEVAYPSILEKNGFQCDAINREVYYHDGRYWNGFTFGILKPEWKSI
ncbi:MAG: hypothetical protein CVU39_19755 [Chloroflexi bacterium HGW-Chloroflexi-10]|jgi:ribosomal-protein-alanine N-acetyltransferase|nr:MAG: hypothetical protein CVU39_19755 [Chloroflexi bacterium HGW-Chloroflexi-10]